ncbi:MAG TPA: response regulator [Vicinamibacteria bacterium]|nr:response regulator [Vicinamibacteria bacterium]
MLKCIVLLAEDFEDTRDVFAFYLRREGFAVHDLPDGERVLPLAIELQPDVIVLDLALPGVDGYALTTQLRAHPLTASLPIVILSAHAYPEDEQRARDAGASAFLRKPCLPHELAATLREVSESCAGAADTPAGQPTASF